MKSASIGVSAHLGWAATAVVAFDRSELRILRTDRIETYPEGDKEALEPYHVAGGFDGLSRVPQPADPRAVVKRGLRKQQRFTARSLKRLASDLADDDRELRRAAVLSSRGRDAPTFEKSIGSHTQIHIQEGLAVRASITTALEALSATVHAIDSKSLLSIARKELHATERALMNDLSRLKPENGGAWRKEEKLAALAAWVAIRR